MANPANIYDMAHNIVLYIMLYSFNTFSHEDAILRVKTGCKLSFIFQQSDYRMSQLKAHTWIEGDFC